METQIETPTPNTVLSDSNIKTAVYEEFWALDEEARNAVRFMVKIGEELRSCVGAQQSNPPGLLQAAQAIRISLKEQESTSMLARLGQAAFSSLIQIHYGTLGNDSMEMAVESMDTWTQLVTWVSEVA